MNATASVPEKRTLGNLAARLLTALALIPFLILAINWENPLAVWLIVLAATGISLREWMRMTMPDAAGADRVVAVATGTALAAAWYGLVARGLEGAVPAAGAAATLALFLYFLWRYGDMESVARRLAFALAGLAYCGLLTFLALVKRLPDGAGWIYVVLTIAWLSDTGAYFAGRFLGPFFPRKLYPSVSPKKTVVGALGGLAASYGALVIAKLWYLPGLTWFDTVAIAVPANLLGQMGDLCESLVKRSVGVKDSGALLPGHGGMLDRIDAVLFVAPYVYMYARWIYG